MIDLIVKKVVARDGEREILESSVEELHNFIVDEIRPDFNDRDILCIKFLQTYCEDDDSAEESAWYINPCYCDEDPHCSSMFSEASPYGPHMDSNFIPELLLVDPPNLNKVLIQFDKFSRFFIDSDSPLSDEQKLQNFLKYYNS